MRDPRVGMLTITSVDVSPDLSHAKVFFTMLDADKEYLATVKLGERTETADAEGRVLESRPVNVAPDQLNGVLARFRGEIEQLPPMHSALKHQGVPLYKMARKGQTIERKLR